MRGIVLIAVAVFIDGLQAGLAFALAGASFAGSALVSWIPFIGVALAGAGSTIGVGLAFTLNAVIALTFGSFLITLLAFSKMAYPRIIIGTALIETLPLVPGWTALVLLSIRQKSQDERRVANEALQHRHA